MTPDNIAFMDLLHVGMKEYIPVEECEQGYLYWGIGSGIGEVAICNGYNDRGELQFRGLAKDEADQDCLDLVVHTQTPPNYENWSPFVRLEVAPTDLDVHATMSWLLEKQIEVVELRLDWLSGMPARMQSAPSYRPVMDENQALLENLHKEQQTGFNTPSTPEYEQESTEDSMQSEAA
jgi:hypothetical protein